jgi:CubicO group peptidase (beta-lactamase class C family)
MEFDKIMNMTPEEQPVINRSRDRYFPTRTIKRGTGIHPLPRDGRTLELTVPFRRRTIGLEAFMEQSRTAGLLILKDGRIVYERYRLGTDETSRWYSYSVGKSVVSTLVGAAIRQGHIGSVEDPVTDYLPILKGSAYDGTTIRHLLQMSSGVFWEEAYRDGQSVFARMYDAIRQQRAGGILEVMRGLPRVAEPGTRFQYKTGETHILAEIVHAATGQRLADYLSERIWIRFGMEADGFWCLESANGQETGGGSCNFTLRDYGRFGLFILNDGVAGAERILPEGWVAEASHPRIDSPHSDYGKIEQGWPLGYGYQWWSFPKGRSALKNHDGAFTGIGIFGQFLYINPQERVIIVHWGCWPDPWIAGHERALFALFGNAIEALR